MRLGVIAGNGRFPFLVLEAARALGHDVTIIAVKEEAEPDLAAAAARQPGTDAALGVARAAGQVHLAAEGRRASRRPSWPAR